MWLNVSATCAHFHDVPSREPRQRRRHVWPCGYPDHFVSRRRRRLQLCHPNEGSARPDCRRASLSAVSQSALSLSAAKEQTNAVKFFKAQAASLKRGSLSTVSAKVTDSGNGRTAVVNYTASVPTAFMGIGGFNNIPVSGSSTAASAIPTYIDFYLLLDNTPSMGVGATPADVKTMVNNTPDQCAFACHELDISPNDYYGLAKKLGVTMRIDVVRSATQQLMDTANAT
jgi:hypothetical protein